MIFLTQSNFNIFKLLSLTDKQFRFNAIYLSYLLYLYFVQDSYFYIF